MTEKDMITFPIHVELVITHNSHYGSHQTVEEYFNMIDADVDDEIRKACIESDSVWKMTFYPTNTVGFYQLIDSTFGGLMRQKDEFIATQQPPIRNYHG